jgi:hypothetical protein
MDHPRGIERSSERAAERIESEKARKERFKLLAEAVRLEPRGLALEQQHECGEPLSFFDQAALDRWLEIRDCLQGEQPSSA